MVDKDDGAVPQARPAGLRDLVELCRNLNLEKTRYIVIGGMAIIQAGFVRATEALQQAGKKIREQVRGGEEKLTSSR